MVLLAELASMLHASPAAPLRVQAASISQCLLNPCLQSGGTQSPLSAEDFGQCGFILCSESGNCLPYLGAPLLLPGQEGANA